MLASGAVSLQSVNYHSSSCSPERTTSLAFSVVSAMSA
jgi:hypothetical protein